MNAPSATPSGRVSSPSGLRPSWTLKPPADLPSSSPALHFVPRRHGCQLEQGAVAARVAVGELAVAVVPVHLEQPFLDAMVEPGAAEDELAEPVDERLAPNERELLPVAHELPPQRASRLLDDPVRSELDEIGGLVLVEVVALHEP